MFQYTLIDLLSLYYICYKYSLWFLIVIFWYWITYVDRKYLHEISKCGGNMIHNISLKKYKKFNNLLEKYCYKQLNTFGIIILGITDGLLDIYTPVFNTISIQTENKTSKCFAQYEQKFVNKNTNTNFIYCVDKEIQIDYSCDESEIKLNNNTIAVNKLFVLKQNKQNFYDDLTSDSSNIKKRFSMINIE